MRASPFLSCCAGALLLWGSAPARTQVVASPESLRVVVSQGQEMAASVTLANAGAAPVPFCLDFDRPLQRSMAAHGDGCGQPGEVLALFDSLGSTWTPHGLTMAPGGRLFVAEWGTFGGVPRYGKTHEFTPDLQYVRTFQHPVLAELEPFPVTEGVTYDADANTLWWTNAEVSGGDVRRLMLLEGTLDGVATGRRIVLPIPPTGPPPTNTGYPKGASYDPATGRFYYVDGTNNTLWAIDTAGVVPEGYPMRLARYPGTYYIGNGVDAHGGEIGGPSGVRLDVPISLTLDNEFDRVTVTDPIGADLGVEFPLPSSVAGAIWVGLVLRSRLDPNGVMYAAYGSFGPNGIAAFRPAPLAPSWLALMSWGGEVPAGGSTSVTLTFRAGDRAPGEYRTTLVVEDTTGAVLTSVPLTLDVEEGTPAEPGPDAAGVSLRVSPNPITGAGAVTVTLARPAADVCVAVYDVLGREVETLHEAPLQAGATRLAIPAGLPPGVYVVRAAVAGLVSTTRFSVVR